MGKPLGNWLALMIGNSRLHWGWFDGEKLLQRWNTPHLSGISEPEWTAAGVGDRASVTLFPQELVDALEEKLPLWMASVVPQQTHLWQHYPHTHLVTPEHIPLANQYATLGIDRSLALWATGKMYGFPAIVIDGGTALTLTAADAQNRFVGGAILPGLGLQLRSLTQQTAALPEIALPNDESLPLRWAVNTTDAMRSGVMYFILAGMQEFVTDWWVNWGEGAIVLTGGDGAWLHHHLTQRLPHQAKHLFYEPDLVLKGIAAIRL